MEEPIKVLDKGFIETIDWMGSDLTVVNSARVSFGTRKDKIDDDDRKLMRYLARNKHWSPFRHISVQFHIKAPEFVMRQLYKHIVGIEVTSASATVDHAWNEISGRYTKVEDFYEPDQYRSQSLDNKQASSGLISQQAEAEELFRQTMNKIKWAYKRLLDLGVAKEQARIILPLCQYSEVYWSASFQAIMNFIDLRDHEHAQWEIRQYAIEIRRIMNRMFPETMWAWEAANKSREKS
jgi:thymidylate synthase (FAD)